MVRYLPMIIEIALLLYALIDCLQTDQKRIRNLPKLGWVMLIVVLPFVGPAAWLFAGRPTRESARQTTWKNPPGVEQRRPLAPDDDPDFLAKLKRDAAERERQRRRDEERRGHEEQSGSDPQGPDPA